MSARRMKDVNFPATNALPPHITHVLVHVTSAHIAPGPRAPCQIDILCPIRFLTWI